MAVVEETRKVIQDFLASELREVKTRLDSIDKRMDNMEKRMSEDKFDLLKRMDDRLSDVLRAISNIDSRISDLMETTRIRERLAVLEARQTN